MKENLAAISTFFGFTLVVPVFLLFRSKDEYVRFWAGQSLVFFVLVFLADTIILQFRLFNFLPSLIFVVTMIVWLIMIYKSWLGDKWQIPLIGKIAKRFNRA